MAMIYLKNANRPGPLTLMTAADYNWRTKIEEDKEFIWVFHHKTASTHGSAEIYLTKELSKYMKIYYNFWSQYSPSCNANDPFFLLPIAYWNCLGVIRPGKALNNFNFIFFVLHNIIFFSLSWIWTNELHACYFFSLKSFAFFLWFNIIQFISKIKHL